MSIAYEFSKIKDAFYKVKNDMIFLSKQISDNYEDFMENHKKLAKEVSALSEKLQKNIEDVKSIHLTSGNIVSESELFNLKEEIKSLKNEISETQTHHNQIAKIVEDVKKDKKDIKELKEKLHSSELEIFLLKERIAEKDGELKHVKEISKSLFDIVTELSKVELDIINMNHKKK